MLLVELPLFARSLNLDLTMITVMSSVPFFANWIFSVVYSKLLDTARAKVKYTFSIYFQKGYLIDRPGKSCEWSCKFIAIQCPQNSVICDKG